METKLGFFWLFGIKVLNKTHIMDFIDDESKRNLLLL